MRVPELRGSAGGPGVDTVGVQAGLLPGHVPALISSRGAPWWCRRRPGAPVGRMHRALAGRPPPSLEDPGPGCRRVQQAYLAAPLIRKFQNL